MNDIKDLLKNAFTISSNVKFNVRIMDSHGFLVNVENKEMTYLQLGMYLVNNNKIIKSIKIQLITSELTESELI